MVELKEQFDTYMGVKSSPNRHEEFLLKRAKKYTKILSYIPGVEMIAVVNSLSMYATDENSDIDLFIVTSPNMIWFVRFFATLLLWSSGAWRHDEDIAGNFCLSFFVTTHDMNLENIAIEEDIYLFYWIYYMKPLYDNGGIYKRFLDENPWASSKIPHGKERISSLPHRKKTMGFFFVLNSFIRYFLMPRTLASYERKGKPEGIIISDTMLKFHDQDKRREIRDAILQKNFDK